MGRDLGGQAARERGRAMRLEGHQKRLTIFVGESRMITAEVPLNVTAVAPSRPLPWIVTVAPTAPLDGERPATVGTIVNVAALVAVP